MADRILVTRSSMPPFEEYMEEIRPLWESHWITNMGEKHIALEEALKAYLGTENICLFSNGHLALELLLEAMELKGEIITTPFTFASTTWAILRAGCTPVFCDIDPERFTLDPAKLEALITERTVAILPVHVYGNLCDTEAIGAVAEKHGLKVIYDAAHAFGVRKDGRGAGTFGDAAMFSFHATKVFHTIEGGAVCFQDPSLADRLFRIKNFGIQENETYCVGGNAKMNEFQAAMGLCNLRHLDGEIEKRRQVFELYGELLSGVPGLTVPHVPEGIRPNYAYYPVVFDPEAFGEDRDSVAARLNAEGIFPRKYFSPCTNSFAFLKNIKEQPGVPLAASIDPAVFDPSKTPVAERIASRVLTIPIYAGLSADDVRRIAGIILRK